MRSSRGGRATPATVPRVVVLLVLAVVAIAARGATDAVARPYPADRLVRRHLLSLGERVLVLSGGALIDGMGGAPLENAVVVIRGERVVAVGRAGEVAIPSRATVVELRGASVLPGIINAHVHSGYRESRLAAWAHDGVTTVRDLCGPEDYALVDRLSTDPSLARVIAAGPFVTVPGGYPIVPWGVTNAVTATTAEEARTAVNRLVDGGADLIKIAIESGADFGRWIPTLSLEQGTAVTEAAHARWVPVSAHVTTSSDLPRALDAGVDDIAHMVVDDPSDALIARVVRDNVIWVPTLELWHWVDAGHRTRAVANLRRFVRAGGTVALGTDFNGYDAPFQLGMPIIEMELMQEAGMTPMQIIVAATSRAAWACNRQNDLGRVAPGWIADLIVVDGDPLEDIHALQNVRLVVRSGTIIRNDGFD
ncbi:MAG: amidohydrolase family protein [Acidobacteriota bacterium]